MNNVLLIARRELQAYLRTMLGYIIVATMLFILGVLFNAWAMSGTAKKSAEIIADFFTLASGCTLVTSAVLGMPLLAKEREKGTIQLLFSAPLRDWEIIVGKYLSALAFLTVFLATSFYMPVLVMAYGKVSAGHLAAGYLGLVLVGSVGAAFGTFSSALTKNQLVAVVISLVMVIALTVFWFLARITDRPLTDAVQSMAWYAHFTPFGQGLVHLKHVVYFVLVTFVALFAATRVLEARRWA
ncbi:MAG: ABC transporter permease subunit [Archangiaceae bacterium]|nr:ABC transporter permease subunit [Archangiaceae bacterium]